MEHFIDKVSCTVALLHSLYKISNEEFISLQSVKTLWLPPTEYSPIPEVARYQLKTKVGSWGEEREWYALKIPRSYIFMNARIRVLFSQCLLTIYKVYLLYWVCSFHLPSKHEIFHSLVPESICIYLLLYYPTPTSNRFSVRPHLIHSFIHSLSKMYKINNFNSGGKMYVMAPVAMSPGGIYVILWLKQSNDND